MDHALTAPGEYVTLAVFLQVTAVYRGNTLCAQFSLVVSESLSFLAVFRKLVSGASSACYCCCFNLYGKYNLFGEENENMVFVRCFFTHILFKFP